MPFLSNVEYYLISSDLIAWQLLLEIAHCIPLSPQSVSSHIISTHLMPSELLHLISSHTIWCLLSLSQLFSADHNGSHLFSSHLSFCHLFSSHLILFFSAFQILTLLNSSQLSAAHVSSSDVFSFFLSNSHIFWALLTSAQLISALVSSSHLISALLSALSNHLTFSLAQNPLQKPISAPKQAAPMLSAEQIWHREAFTHSKLLHREACARRSFCTELGKLLFTASFYTSKLLYTASFYPKKLLHTEAFTEKLLHTASFDTKKLLHRKAFTHRKLLHTEAFTQLLHTEAFTQLLPTASLHAEKLLHTESFNSNTAKLLHPASF